MEEHIGPAAEPLGAIRGDSPGPFRVGPRAALSRERLAHSRRGNEFSQFSQTKQVIPLMAGDLTWQAGTLEQ